MGSSSDEYETGHQYLVETPHSKEECLRAMDEVRDMGPDVLEQWSWGCKYGDHTGYAMVDADSESEAREYVPPSMRDRAKMHKLDKLTPEQVESFHQSK